jgi:Protein of unknown function (DUF3176)
MDQRTFIPGGWPLYNTDSKVEKHHEPASTEAVSSVSIRANARPLSTVCGITDQQAYTITQVPTARTTRSRPFSAATGETDNVYVDASESLEGLDEMKQNLATISSKDGSATPPSEDASATTLSPEQPPQPVTAKAILMKAMFSRYWADWWIWEFLSLLLSFLSLSAIVITLGLYNHTPLTSWPSPMTPNAFIAIFIALAQVGLVVPVYNAIGQLKWLWFRFGERPLIDFETFDEASRGHIGGLKLIGTLKGGYVCRYKAIYERDSNSI